MQLTRATTRILRVGLMPVVMGLALMLPTASALAAPSEHLMEHNVDFGCSLLRGPGADAYLQPSWNSTFGSDARLQLWLHPADVIVDPPTIVSGAADFTVGAGDSSLTGSFELIDAVTGQLAGTGWLDAVLVPSGDLVYPEWPKSSSNTKHRETHVTQPVVASGTVTLTIGDRVIVMSLEDCNGSVADFSAFFNHPASYVEWFHTRSVSCFFVGESMSVNLTGFDEYDLVSSEVVVQTATGSYATLDDGSVTFLSRHAYRTTLDLVPGGIGLASGDGTVTIDASLTPLARSAWTEEVDGATIRVVEQPYAITGTTTVVLPDGTTETFAMDGADCHGGELSLRLIDRP